MEALLSIMATTNEQILSLQQETQQKMEDI